MATMPPTVAAVQQKGGWALPGYEGLFWLPSLGFGMFFSGGPPLYFHITDKPALQRYICQNTESARKSR